MNFERAKHDPVPEDCHRPDEQPDYKIDRNKVRLIPESPEDGQNFLEVMKEIVDSVRDQRLHVEESRVGIFNNILQVGRPDVPNYVLSEEQFSEVVPIVERMAELSPREGTRQLAAEMNAECLLDMMNVSFPDEVPRELLG